MFVVVATGTAIGGVEMARMATFGGCLLRSNSTTHP